MSEKEQKQRGRKSSQEVASVPGQSLGKALLDVRKAIARLEGVSEDVLGEKEGVTLRQILDEGSLRPEVERIARKLNNLGENEFSAIAQVIEGQISMIEKLKKG